MLQSVTLIGRLGRDAKICETTNGERFIALTVAVSEKVHGVEKTTWYDVTSFNAQHQGKMLEYLKKGTMVVVIGRQSLSVENGTDGKAYLRARVSADMITFGGGGGTKDNTDNSTSESPNGATAVPEAPAEKAAEEEIVVTSTKKKTAPTATAAPSASNDDEDLPF